MNLRYLKGVREGSPIASDVAVRAWGPLIDADFAESIVHRIEACSELPRQKIVPDDKLAPAFHGPLDSDMPFGRFSREVYTLYGMKITIAFVQSALDIESATIRDFVQVLFNQYRNTPPCHNCRGNSGVP